MGRKLLNFFCSRFKVERESLFGFHTEYDVLGNGEIMYQLEMLMHHTDSHVVGLGRVLYVGFLSADCNASPVGGIEPEQNRHQGRFSCAVLPEEGENLSLIERDTYIVICNNSGEFFADVFHFNNWFHRSSSRNLF